MYRASLLFVLALTAFAQTETDYKIPSADAPKEVDAALRARVSQFYQAHVDGKFRLADQVVAEESKDAFFASAKRQYLGFEIISTTFSEDLKRARAVVSCKGEWSIRGEALKVNMPIASEWKFINDQWFWFLPSSAGVPTPFGMMHYDTGGPKEKAAPIPDPMRAAQAILSAVKIDKTAVTLSSYEPSSAEVKITNGLQGPIKLRADINGAFKGLTHKLDKETVPAGQTATLTFKSVPPDKAAKPMLKAYVYVEPTNQVLSVELVFSIPPEIEKQIPKELRKKTP